MSNELVVKTNKLNSAVQNLSLAEIHIIQIGIVDSRETGEGLSTDKPLRIEAKRYAEVFNTTLDNAYQRLKEAEDSLFKRQFRFIDADGKHIKSRWIQDTRYLDNEGALEITFTRVVVEAITRIDGKEINFTKYLLEQTAQMKSYYSVRLYELLIQWKGNKGKTPLFELQHFKEQLGLELTEYQRMYDFKKYVLESSIKEINAKSDITVKYEQVKQGRKIIGFKFFFTPKKTKEKQVKPSETWKTKGLTDKQIKKLAVYKEEFIDANTDKIANSDTRGYNEIFEEWKALLKDPKQAITFKKIQVILDKNDTINPNKPR